MQHVLVVTNWLDFSFLSSPLSKFFRKYDTWTKYRHTVNELSSLSDKELRDIGISRGMIHSIAMEVYYDNLDKVENTNSNLKGWV